METFRLAVLRIRRRLGDRGDGRFLFGGLFSERSSANLGADFFVTLTSELFGLAGIIIRLLAGRTRPSNHLVPQGFYGLWHDGHWIAEQYKFSSFSSGHAATAAGLVAAARLGRDAGDLRAGGDVVAHCAPGAPSVRRAGLGGAGHSVGDPAEENPAAVPGVSFRQRPARVENWRK